MTGVLSLFRCPTTCPNEPHATLQIAGAWCSRFPVASRGINFRSVLLSDELEFVTPRRTPCTHLRPLCVIVPSLPAWTHLGRVDLSHWVSTRQVCALGPLALAKIKLCCLEGVGICWLTFILLKNGPKSPTSFGEEAFVFQRPGCESRLARFAAGPLKNKIDLWAVGSYKHATPTGFEN